MYHQHASVGLRPKQYTKVVPRCPVCGKLRIARKRIAVTTYTAKREIVSYKTFEVCNLHLIFKLRKWAKSINAKLGIQLDPRYIQAMGG